jgi:hypothetical protein
VRKLYFILLIGLLTVIASCIAWADSYPNVAFSFDSESFTYTYTVTVTSADTYPLGYLELDTLVKNLAGPNEWSMHGPVPNEWGAYSQEYDTGKDAAIWFAQTGEQEIYPDQLTEGSPWVGVFTLVARDTAPGQNVGLTMDGIDASHHQFVIYVPGPSSLVPEPTGLLLALGGVMGFGGMLFRRRKI